MQTTLSDPIETSSFDPSLADQPSYFKLAPRPALRSLGSIDRDFAERVPREDRDLAGRLLRLRMQHVPRGVWQVDPGTEEDACALLVVAGTLLRDSCVDGHWSCEVVGPEDVIQPWEGFSANELVSGTCRWQILEPATLAVVDRRFAIAAARWPGLLTELTARAVRRTRLLSALLCASRIRRLDDRLLLVMRLLSERWGYVRPDGVHIRLTVSHETLARLACAHRPSVSTSLARLERRGELRRNGRHMVLPLEMATA